MNGERNKKESYLRRYVKCEKNVNHSKYLTVNNLDVIPVPPQYRHQCLPTFLLHMQLLTVHIIVDTERGTVIDGSGFVQRVDIKSGQSCPVDNCRLRNSEHEWGVATVYHVVGTDIDAKNSIVSFFYDFDYDKISRNRRKLKKVKVAKGVKLVQNDRDEGEFDWACFHCVSHNTNLLKSLKTYLNIYKSLQGKLYQIYKTIPPPKLVIIVSHPHGGPKKVSYGHLDRRKEIMKLVRSNQDWGRYYYTAVTCPGSSGAPIFISGQPISGFGYWFGHPHNHGGSDKEFGYSSVGVDHPE
ncbi:hypothetical protein Btru_002494 [Bulinus truncatus]|nr:hypothetical protein Btru_002494 [Bulinus truncatus]